MHACSAPPFVIRRESCVCVVCGNHGRIICQHGADKSSCTNGMSRASNYFTALRGGVMKTLGVCFCSLVERKQGRILRVARFLQLSRRGCW